MNDETLSLRKDRHRQELFSRRNYFINKRSKYCICPAKLNGIPQPIQDHFRINNNDLDNTIQKTIEYLYSKELVEIQFGAFLLRKYFEIAVSKEEEMNKKGLKYDFHVDKFIEKDIIKVIGKVLFTESNINILYELTWALINLTYFDTLKNGFGYIKEFINPTYAAIYFKLVNLEDNEITEHLYNYLSNCIIECDEFAKFLFSNENFIKNCISKYLKPQSSIKVDQDARKATVSFFVCLIKLSDIFNEKQKNTFYKIFEGLISVMQFDSEILFQAIVGIRYLFYLDKSKEKVVYNIIKNNNYTLFDKMFLSINEKLKNENDFDELDTAIYNISSIINKYILLSEEKDVIIILQKTQLLNFIEAIYTKIYLKSIKNALIDILVKISHHSPNVVNNMVKGHESLMQNIIKGILKANNFDIRMKGIEIVYYMLNLNSLDINVELYRTGIIDQIVSDNLINDEDSGCLKFILNGILLFINSIKTIEPNWTIEIINNLIKIGITNGLENNTTRFNEEHNLIINQIKNDINAILNYKGGSSENKIENDNTPNPNMINLKLMNNNNGFYNPFLNYENKINCGNDISFEKNNENVSNENNPFNAK